MANPTFMTYADIVSASESDEVALIDVVARRSPLLRHLMWIPTDAGEKNTYAYQMVTEHPSFDPIGFNEGSTVTKAGYEEASDGVTYFEDRTAIDVKYRDQMPKKAEQFRKTQGMIKTSGMANSMAQQILYGNKATNERQINGLMTRYNALSGIASYRSSQIVDAGGTGSDNASIVIMAHGQTGIHGIYPAASTYGINITAEADWKKIESTGAILDVYGDKIRYSGGIATPNPRAFVRIANIDVSDILGSTPIDIHPLINEALSKLSADVDRSTLRCYTSSSVALAIQNQAADNNNRNTMQNIFKDKIFETQSDFMVGGGIPGFIDDAMLETEARVV